MRKVAERPTILVVDDEPLTLMAAMDIIDSLGFRSIAAPNADEAIAIMEHRDDVRAVFTDVNMPGSMDGVQFACAVRKRWPPVKILVASGYPLNEPNLLPIGSAFLKKPYGFHALESGLRDVFA